MGYVVPMMTIPMRITNGWAGPLVPMEHLCHAGGQMSDVRRAMRKQHSICSQCSRPCQRRFPCMYVYVNLRICVCVWHMCVCVCCCYFVAILLLFCCYSVAILLLFCCYFVAILLLFCCYSVAILLLFRCGVWDIINHLMPFSAIRNWTKSTPRLKTSHHAGRSSAGAFTFTS